MAGAVTHSWSVFCFRFFLAAHADTTLHSALAAGLDDRPVALLASIGTTQH